MQGGNSDSGVEKLYAVLTPLFKEMVKDMKDHIEQQLVVTTLPIMLEVKEVKHLVNDMNKTAGGAKRGIKTTKIDATIEPAAASPDQPPVSTAPVKQKFPTKNTWFRDHCKSPGVLDSYLSQDLREIAEKDQSIQSKAKKETKDIAIVLMIWNFAKSPAPGADALAARIEADYQLAKAAHENAIKPKQQTSEPHTPPN